MPPGALLKLQALDPELGLILSGEAPAELELAVVTGTWADAAPTQEQRQEAAKAARIQEILAADPFPTQGHYEGEGDAATYVPGNPGNLTLQMELAQLDPALAQRLSTEAQPPAQQQGLSQEGADFVNSRLFAAHIGAS